MQYTPQQITEKLLKTLDKDNNVKDLPGLLEVISILERYPITRETLEQTRIGKYINEMRKKTTDKDLAKRAKNLVRKWKDLVGTKPHPPAVNGEGIVIKAGGGKASCLPQHMVIHSSGSKPASPISRPSTPSSCKSNLSPSMPSAGQLDGPHGTCSRPVTPSGAQQSKVSPRSMYSRPGTPANQDGQSSVRLTTPPSPAVGSSRLSPNLPAKSSQQHTPTTSRPGTPGAHSETLSKTNAANKKRRRHEEVSPEIAFKRHMGDGAEVNNRSKCQDKVKTEGSKETMVNAMNGQFSGHHRVVTDSESIVEGKLSKKGQALKVDVGLKRVPSMDALAKTPKVKTTAQLIEDLNKSGMKLTGSETAVKIAQNRIEKELDPVNEPVVPPEAKPRPRRKPGSQIQPPHTPAHALSKTKTELVERFLKTSVTPSTSEMDLVGPIKDDPVSRTESPISLNSSSPVPPFSNRFDPSELPKVCSAGADLSSSPKDPRSGEGDRDEVSSEQVQALSCDPWSLLPPLNLDNIDWNSHEYEEPVIAPVTEASVDRLHSDQWQGVNGQFDHQRNWHDWTTTYSMPTYNEERLHLLPYVNIDD